MATIVDKYEKATKTTMTFVNHVKKNIYTYIFVLLFILFSVIIGILTYASVKTLKQIENPIEIYEKIADLEEQKHTASFEKRMESSPQIQSTLDMMMLDLSCDRAFIIEMHNGKYNAAGLSFNYGEVNYEISKHESEYIMDIIGDFQLNKFPFFSTIYSLGHWYGNIDDLAKIDRRFAYVLKANDVNYLYIKTIYGRKSEIGFLAVAYDEKPKLTEYSISTKMDKYSSKISPLLDGTIIVKK